ncbi:MAG: chemotaxis protein CheX [Cyclobacteriaceae bacterium]|nr:chemotaxis protein CheX [Cyclobacteriaceae bacterium HetDA_MAG_MS6]
MDTQQEQFEKTVNVFINSVDNYFTYLTKQSVSTSAPYVKDANEVMLKECTGMIGISGNKKGFIYISGGMDMYRDLIKTYVGLDNPSTNDMLDMAGELSNVVAGNVRQTYSNEFMITVPIVFQGSPTKLKFPDDVPIYVIPIKWNQHEAYMVIGLK